MTSSLKMIFISLQQDHFFVLTKDYSTFVSCFFSQLVWVQCHKFSLTFFLTFQGKWMMFVWRGHILATLGQTPPPLSYFPLLLSKINTFQPFARSKAEAGPRVFLKGGDCCFYCCVFPREEQKHQKEKEKMVPTECLLSRKSFEDKTQPKK